MKGHVTTHSGAGAVHAAEGHLDTVSPSHVTTDHRYIYAALFFYCMTVSPDGVFDLGYWLKVIGWSYLLYLNINDTLSFFHKL